MAETRMSARACPVLTATAVMGTTEQNGRPSMDTHRCCSFKRKSSSTSSGEFTLKLVELKEKKVAKGTGGIRAVEAIELVAISALLSGESH